MTTADIEELLDWKPAEEKGPHKFRQATAGPEFCRYYNDNSKQFKASGVHFFRSSADSVSFAWFLAGPYAPKLASDAPVVPKAASEPVPALGGAEASCRCPGACPAKVKA